MRNCVQGGVPASGRNPTGWTAPEQFHVVLNPLPLNATELTQARERGPLFRSQVSGLRQHPRPMQPVLTRPGQKTRKAHAPQDHGEIKPLKRTGSGQGKGHGRNGACPGAGEKMEASARRTRNLRPPANRIGPDLIPTECHRARLAMPCLEIGLTRARVNH